MILLTGATGKTGAEIARVLTEQGMPLRALVRDAAKAAALETSGVELVVGDMADEASLGRALEGVERAALILANSEQQERLEKQFIDAAARAGTRHVVKLSSMEANPGVGTPIAALHFEVEHHLRESGMHWTMVRPNFFMQNLLASAGTIREQQKFFLPMGRARTGMSDIRDVAAVMAAALSGAGHEDRSYDVTGPELLSFHDVAARFSEALGTSISYVDMPLDAYRQMLARFVDSAWQLDAVCDLFAGIVAGGLEHITDTVSQVLGRAPISLAQFIQDHLEVFQDS